LRHEQRRFHKSLSFKALRYIVGIVGDPNLARIAQE